MGRKEDAIRILMQAIDGWKDHGVTYISPYFIGAGGEGCVIAAEQHLPSPAFGSPCASYVAIKIPVNIQKLEAEDPEGDVQRIPIDQTYVLRLRAEYEKRLRLGALPHTGQQPAIHRLPLSQIRQHNWATDRLDDDEDSLPVLVTPIRLNRPGAIPITLEKVIPLDGCWCSRELFNWRAVAHAISLALWSMHAIGWAHSDVKPSNIVLHQSSGTWHDINLIDFGMVQPDWPQAMRPAAGTPTYIRPIRHFFTLDARPGEDRDLVHLTPSTEDVYALGVSLLEVLIGKKRRKEIRDECRAQSDNPYLRQANDEIDAAMYGRKLIEEAWKAAEDPNAPKMRSTAIQCCLTRLMQLPVHDNGMDLVSAFLTALDTHLPLSPTARVGAGSHGALAAQIRGLRELGDARNGPSCADYINTIVDLASIKINAVPSSVRECMSVLRHGYGRKSADLLEHVLECKLGSDASIGDLSEAYEIAHGLRVFAGLLMIREESYARATKVLDAAEHWLENIRMDDDGTCRDFLAWWIGHLKLRVRVHKAAKQRRESRYAKAWGRPIQEAVKSTGTPINVDVIHDEARAPVCLPPAIRNSKRIEDVREVSRADAWQTALSSYQLLQDDVLINDELIAQMLQQRDNTESSYEAAYGALLIGQALANNARCSENGIEPWNRAVSTLYLSAGWALVRGLHHEYAAVLVITAAIMRRVFARSSIPEADAPAAQPARAPNELPPTMLEGHRPAANPPQKVDAQDAKPQNKSQLASLLRHHGADAEECLLAAAECAIKAADMYEALDTPDRCTAALMLAAECHRWCSAPEHQAEAIRWLMLARNNAELRQRLVPPGIDEHIRLAVQAWATTANDVYERTAGMDPGAFLTRAMLTRYGVAMKYLFGNSLTTELFDDDDPTAPRTGAAFHELLRLATINNVWTQAGQTRVLVDIGCGLGLDSIQAARLGYENVIGIDALEWCVSIAEENKKHAGIGGAQSSNVEFMRGDFANAKVSLPGGKLANVVLSRDTLARITNKREALGRVSTMLKNNGILLMTEWYQKAVARHDEWSLLCETAWLTGLETERSLRQLLEQAKLKVLVFKDYSEQMGRFFAWSAAVASRQRNETRLDQAALLRAERDMALLSNLCRMNDGPLGWAFIIARRMP